MKLRDIFHIQKKDRQALLTLLAIILMCLSLVFFIQGNQNEESVVSQVNDIVTRNSQQECNQQGHNQQECNNQQVSKEHPLYSKEEGVVHELFPFDPNTADASDLERLGLESWQIKSICRFREKGGIFSRPSDFARIYGITKKTYETLLPFIQIADDYRPASDFYGKESYKREGRRPTPYYNRESYNDSRRPSSEDSPTNGQEANKDKVYSYPHKLKANEHIEINSADTTELMKIPGIGSYFARSITKYREKLGGFASTQQLEEIEGFPKSALAFMEIDPSHINKMNINKLTLNQLRRHPYLNFYQAQEICNYRRLKGPLHSLEDLKLLQEFPPDEIERLKPYICF